MYSILLLFFLYFTRCDSYGVLTNQVEELRASDFPKGFIFSTATAAYQVEGAWNEGGKGENIWDRAIHTIPGYIANDSNADVACDSYHKYKEDIELIKKTGFSMYRFSMSWSRILPKGTPDYINEEGLQYYRNVLDELSAHKIEPMVTLYHYDLPQPLQDIGGWLNETMVDYFQNYSKVVFENFGSQVKWWVTINEPLDVTSGYGTADFPPNVNLHGFGEYIAAHNLLKGHARVYRMYEKHFKEKQKGRIGLAIDGHFAMPKSSSLDEDVRAAEQFNQFTFGWLAHPVYSSVGDYPPAMRNIIDTNSIREGLNQSRLPYFTPEEIQQIKGSYDFLGHNHYSSSLATFGATGVEPSIWSDCNVSTSADPKWPTSGCNWLSVYPEGIRKAVNWFRDQYGEDIPIFITENGFCDDGSKEDYERVSYYDSYLKELLKAINEDSAKVIGYTSWSIMDNFEWRGAYSQRFGIHHVNFTDPERPRSEKISAKYWQRFLLQRE